MQFATNFMGHFALTTGLHEALAAAGGARIVSVSSSGNLFSPVVFDDLHFDFRPYDPFVAYGQSKTADVLLAVEATRQWSGEGIYANALNPGAIATNLQKHIAGCGRRRSGRRPSGRVRPRPSCSPHRRCSTRSAAATSRTATRPPSSPADRPTTPVSPGTPWTPATPSASGTRLWACWTSESTAYNRRGLKFPEDNAGRFTWHDTISRHYTLDQVNDVFDSMAGWQEIKPLIDLA